MVVENSIDPQWYLFNVLQPGAVVFDDDLLANSRTPIETILRVGERIGLATPGPAGRFAASSPEVVPSSPDVVQTVKLT